MFLAGMLPLFVGDTMAQQIPNAGVLQRDAEQGFKSLPPNKVHPQESEVAKPIAPKQGEVTLNVKAFKFSGNKLLSQEVLAKVLSPYLNHPLTFAQLRGAVDEIMNAYKDAGWLVRAYLPKQEIDAGVVQIEIIEGVFGGTQVDGESSHPRRSVDLHPHNSRCSLSVSCRLCRLINLRHSCPPVLLP